MLSHQMWNISIVLNTILGIEFRASPNNSQKLSLNILNLLKLSVPEMHLNVYVAM